MTCVCLRAAGVALILDASGVGLPRVLHWGADPGELDDAALVELAADLRVGVPHSALDEPWPFTLLPGR